MQRAFLAQETSQRETKIVRGEKNDRKEHISCHTEVMSQATPLIWR